MNIRHCVWVAGLVCVTQAAIVAAGTSRCSFERATASFAGSAHEQARCLLSPVLPFGHVPEGEMGQLPDVLRGMIGKSIDIDVDAFKGYLDWLGKSEQSLGGSLDEPLSSNKRGIEASYFVIHDTSLEMNQPFPADLDTSYYINRLDRYANKGKGAHVFVNRMGDTLVNKDFSMPSRATKLENQTVPRRLSRGLFLHIELVQPRNREPGRYYYIAPDPAFSPMQYQMLALLYVASSVRKGQWLIPAYHRLVDDGLNAHDDPQGFDLDYWSAWIGSILLDVSSMPEAGTPGSGS